ncbi:MAG TPA: hypothetical protein VNG31_03005 [Candidatus Baltobacteraceae bacterium]|nr:hypothetical protein [Candidatus Baltobacteraceae bacterium]
MRLLGTLVALLVLSAACSSPSGNALSPHAFVIPANAVGADGMQISATYTAGITPGAAIYDFANGPDGRIWFTEFEGNNIGAITTAGVVTEYPSSATFPQPNGITVGPTNADLWTGGYGGTVIDVATTGTQTNYAVTGAHIGDIVAGHDGNLWFTDYGNNKIGRITTAGAVTEFALPANASPSGIAVDAKGRLWITDGGNKRIIKMKTTGKVVQSYGTGISPGEYPQYIVAAPDGNLYFTEAAFNSTLHDKIGRISTSGKIAEVATLAPESYPDRLTIGKDGNLYVCLYSRPAVVKYVISKGKMKLMHLPLSNDHGTSAIINGPDNRLWLGGRQTIYAVSY